MSSLAFVTHPSVRIKGTENVYTPTQCMDERCPVKAPHLHCPLCVKTDAYQDPVILKAHYRVKHVDKGIDFAGLKILRCCDQCDIIGIIKGEKRFKGAHWHCYRCRNGFNRRDEAIKHYKTHFRNPQTTFQIQITQDLNSPPEIRSHEDHHVSMQDSFGPVHNPMETIIRPQIAHQHVQIGDTNLLKTVSNSIHHGKTLAKVKHEPMEKEDEETIMIIQGTQLETALASHIIDSGNLGQLGKTGMDSNLSWEIRYRIEEEEKNMYKAKAEDYKAQVDLLKQQVSDLESQLAQQRQICFHELMDMFASDDHAQKQAASEQVAKLLEQCQAYMPGASTAVMRANSIQQSETEGATDIQQHSQVAKAAGLPALMHDFDSGHDSCTAGLMLADDETDQKPHPTSNDIADEFQVICTSSAEGQVIMGSTLDVGSGSMRSEQDIDLDTPGNISVQQPEQAAMLAQILGQAEQSGIEVQSVLPEMSSDDAGDPSLDPGSCQGLVAQGDGTGLMGSECLMEVVAANGLASLGQDVGAAVTHATSDNDLHHTTQGAFMVTLDDGGQGILIQHTAGDAGAQQDSSLHSKDNHSSKNFKVS